MMMKKSRPASSRRSLNLVHEMTWFYLCMTETVGSVEDISDNELFFKKQDPFAAGSAYFYGFVLVEKRYNSPLSYVGIPANRHQLVASWTHSPLSNTLSPLSQL